MRSVLPRIGQADFGDTPNSLPSSRRRVKQVRFGKLAFLQLNGAFFEPKMLVFGHFALRFQRETGKLALWPGNHAYLCVFRIPGKLDCHVKKKPSFRAEKGKSTLQNQMCQWTVFGTKRTKHFSLKT